MTFLDIDIETYCDLNLPDVGVYRYAAHPSFEILMAGWCIDDGPITVVEDPIDILEIPGLWDADVVKSAHNANFERICFSRLWGLPEGEYLDPEEWLCTASIAAEFGYSRELELTGKALGVFKDSAGTRLINLFSKPNRGRRIYASERPEQWSEFKRYCGQDVEVARHIRKTLGGWPTGRERQIYMTDQRINDRGMLVDIPLAERAHRAALVNKTVHEREFIELTGVANPGSNPQVMEWGRRAGLDLPNLQAETVTALLETSLSPDHRRVLELRQELALVAAKKFSAALQRAGEDHRLRGAFIFHGAHTGRWTGKGLQPHNLPRASFDTRDAFGQKVYDLAGETDAVLELMMDGTASPLTLKQLVRPMFLGPMTVADYASIEARVIAWLSGEEWATKAFLQGRDIYVETAERMSTPGHKLTRAQGKIAVLALGFNGSVGSLRAMGADGTDEQLLTLVRQWRKANPHIVRFWSRLDEAFRQGRGQVGPIRVESRGTDRALRLPSGRRLWYHDVKETRGKRPGETRITFVDWTKHGWRVDTYGGRLTENVVQAVARDILGEALVRLERNGFQPVAHVHDEILVEGEHTVEDVVGIMTESPRWATGLPIDAEGFTCLRYRKG